MRTKSDFWLVLHQLVGELHLEGDSDEVRVHQLLSNLENQPAATRSVNCANLDFAIGVLNHLATQCRNSGGER